MKCKLILLVFALSFLIGSVIVLSHLGTSLFSFQRHTSATEYAADLSAVRNDDWKFERLKIDGGTKLDIVRFLGNRIGFAIDDAPSPGVYRTENGGQHWKHIGHVPDSSCVDDIFFKDREVGFVLTCSVSATDVSGNSGQILKTEDGGLSWRIVARSDSVDFERITFNAMGIGVTVGKTIVSSPKSDSHHAIFVSFDDGNTWQDVSSRLNQIAQRTDGKVGDFLTNVVASSENRIIVLSLNHKIYETQDFGREWTLISQFINRSSHASALHFGELDDDNIWVAGGRLSVEGTWGMFAVFDLRSASWTIRKLSDFVFLDVAVVGNKEQFAAGARVPRSNLGGANHLNQGVVLRSTDEGKSWSVIYESSTATEYSALAVLAPNKLLAAGDQGELILLERSRTNR